MLRLAFRFPAGHYHATPWGQHVNEGDIEWPPSPWRIYRALLATGFTKLGWPHVPPAARTLLEKLTAVTPTMYLPPASLGHTRHYMPIAEGRTVTTTKEIDAFAAVGREENAVLGVAWEVALTEPEIAIVDALAATIGYLGRAESWATAERVTAFPPGLIPCAASESAPGPGYERVPLLAPLDPGAYARFREEAVARDLATADPKEPAKKKAARLAKLAEVYPEDVIAVLLTSIAKFEKSGWSQPPGTRWIAYWRDAKALTTAPERVTRPARKEGLLPITALLSLASDTVNADVRPRLTDALWRAERIHAALVKLSDERGGSPSRGFTGKDDAGKPLSGHQHAMILPLAIERPGRIDHVLIHAPMGFDAPARAALGKIRRMWAKKNEPEMFVTLVGLGAPADFASVVPHVREAAVWTSVTPFVPPRFLKAKGRDSLEGQVQAELLSRGIPAATRVEVELEGGAYCSAEAFWSLWEKRRPRAVVLGGGAVVEAAVEAEGAKEAGARLAQRWRHFRMERGGDGKGPPIAAGFGLRVTFAEAVMGPVALGYAAHFGLGLLGPAESGEKKES
jgi:CRISPR-associated protein Csb2